MYFKNIDKLIELEGLKTKVYLDSAAKKTIGIGHLLNAEELLTSKIKIDGKYIDYSLGISQSDCKKLCMQDLERFCYAVEDFVKIELTQNQFDALVIFCFNVGVDAFKKSTLLKILNDGDYEGVPAQLRRWNKSGGKEVQGLNNRRQAEIDLWNT